MLARLDCRLMSLSLTFLMAFAALIVERFVGYPRPLQNFVGHPVQWMGDLLTFVDHGIHRSASAKVIDRAKGIFALTVLIACVLLITVPLALQLRSLPYGWIGEALLATPLLAQHDLRRFVLAVADALDQGLEQAGERSATSSAAIPERSMRAASSAPRSRAWPRTRRTASSRRLSGSACLGLPGIAVYKAINTADSMIGHKSPRYIDFGWAAARLDDLVNLPASRLTGTAHRGGGIADQSRPRRRCHPVHGPRCKEARLAQCRLARGGARRRARGSPRRPALLFRRSG